MTECPICGARTSARLPYPGRKAGAAIRFDAIELCERCGTGTASPRPDQAALDRFYASGAYWHDSSGPRQMAHEASQAWRRVRCVKQVTKRDALAVADVGAGHGGIARALAGQYMRVSRYAFVEPDRQAAESIEALQLPFPVLRAGSLSGLRGPFDLLFLNHVLEHVADPVQFLASAMSQVAAGGIVYVETPHADHRFKDDVFPHVSFFTTKALSLIGERLGVRTHLCEAFGRLPAPRLHPVGLVQRLAARALPLMAGWNRAQRLLDGILWRYAPTADGVWLRWIFSAADQTRQAVGTKAR